MCAPDLGCAGGNNDIDAGTDTDFVGACTPAPRHCSAAVRFFGIAGSNSAEGMDVRLLCLLCVV